MDNSVIIKGLNHGIIVVLDSDIDYVFCDLWHDASDGKDLYLKLKKFEEKYKNIKFDYWIEKTIKYYL